MLARARRQRKPSLDAPPQELQQDWSESLRRAEAENRVLENRFRDLEFELEEQKITNDLLRKKQPVRVESSEVVELKKSLQKIETELIDSIAIRDYTSFQLSERKADLAFLNREIAALKSGNVSDEQGRLEEQIEATTREIELVTGNLAVLEKEEQDAAEAVKSRQVTLSQGVQAKQLPKDWSYEKSEMLEQSRSLQDDLQHEMEIQKELMDELDNVVKGPVSVNEEELKWALAAELMIAEKNDVQMAIDAELALRQELEAELAEVRADAEAIKRHRDEVVNRHQMQYALAAQTDRLKALQAKLEEYMKKKKRRR